MERVWRVVRRGVLVIGCLLLLGSTRGLAAVGAAPAGLSLPELNCYRSIEAVYARAEALVKLYPNLAAWVDIGDSWEKTQDPAAGWDMRVLRLTNKAITGEKPDMVLVGGLQALDLAGTELSLRFAEKLLVDYATAYKSRWILDQTEIHLILLANPDGRERVEQNLGALSDPASRTAIWNKNTHAFSCIAPGELDGVSLNHNFGYQWNTVAEPACGALYQGQSAVSEPETQAIQDYLETVFGRAMDANRPVMPADASGLVINLTSYGYFLHAPEALAKDPAALASQLTLLRFRAQGTAGLALPAETPPRLAGSLVGFTYGGLGVPTLNWHIGYKQDNTFPVCVSSQEPPYLEDALQIFTRAARLAAQPLVYAQGPEVTSLSAGVVFSGNRISYEILGRASSVLPGYLPGPGDPLPAPIKSVRYAIDLAPWQSPMWKPLTFTEISSEPGSVLFDLQMQDSELPDGEHTLYFQALDDHGIAGMPAAVTLSFTSLPANTLYLPAIGK